MYVISSVVLCKAKAMLKDSSKLELIAHVDKYHFVKKTVKCVVYWVT